MRLKLLYRNKEWLYSIYCSDDQSEYVLAAIFPGVMWEDVVIRLTPEEVLLFESGKSTFLDFVNHIIQNRNSNEIKPRRIQMTYISDEEIDI